MGRIIKVNRTLVSFLNLFLIRNKTEKFLILFLVIHKFETVTKCNGLKLV